VGELETMEGDAGRALHLGTLVTNSDTGEDSEEDMLSPDTVAAFSLALNELGVGRNRQQEPSEPPNATRARQLDASSSGRSTLAGRPHMTSHHRSHSAGTIPSELARTLESPGAARTTYHHHHHHIHHSPSIYTNPSLPRRTRSRASLLSLDSCGTPKPPPEPSKGRKEAAVLDEEAGRYLPLPCPLLQWVRGGKYASRIALWRVLAAGIGLVALLHAAFCGLLFFQRYPVSTTSIADMWDDLEVSSHQRAATPVKPFLSSASPGIRGQSAIRVHRVGVQSTGADCIYGGGCPCTMVGKQILICGAARPDAADEATLTYAIKSLEVLCAESAGYLLGGSSKLGQASWVLVVLSVTLWHSGALG
jgi:hypothetical protein